MAQGLIALFDFIFEPFSALLIYAFPGITDIVISPGVGQIEWFSIGLLDLISFVFAFLVGWFFIKFVYFLIKKFFRIIGGAFR